MGVVESVCHLHDRLDHLGGSQPRRGEIGSVDETHREPRLVVGDPVIVNRDDRRMIECRHRPRLIAETLLEIGVRRPSDGDHLHRLAAAELFVLDDVDVAHATRTQQFDHAITGDGRSRRFRQLAAFLCSAPNSATC